MMRMAFKQHLYQFKKPTENQSDRSPNHGVMCNIVIFPDKKLVDRHVPCRGRADVAALRDQPVAVAESGRAGTHARMAAAVCSGRRFIGGSLFVFADSSEKSAAGSREI
jgi:hypothetical protein